MGIWGDKGEGVTGRTGGNFIINMYGVFLVTYPDQVYFWLSLLFPIADRMTGSQNGIDMHIDLAHR